MAVSFCRRSFLKYKNCLFQSQRRIGYVVLIPETPNEVADFDVISLENLPNFSKLDVTTTVNLLQYNSQQLELGSWELHEHLEKQLNKLDKIDAVKNIIEPLEVLTIPFVSSWGICKALYVGNNKLMTLSKFAPLSDRVNQITSEKFNKSSFYNACKLYFEEEGEKSSEELKRILKKYIWEGTHNGLGLDIKQKEHLRKCVEVLLLKRQTYEKKYINSKSLFKLLISEEKFVENSPADLVRCASLNKEEPSKGPWVITLTDALYNRYLEYCPSRDARQHIWTAYNQLASNFLDQSCNACFEVEEIRERRMEFARILGFPTYAHLSMKTKMAGSVEKVQEVLTELLEPAKYGQEKEIFELEQFAYENDFKQPMELWDLPYWKRLEREVKFDLNERKLNEYFPLGQVLLGLFALCEQLFGIEIQEQPEVESWAPDVRYFRISDEKTKAILGGFYFDPYAKPQKIMSEDNSGWFVTMRPRSRVLASLPLSALVFSFTPPNEERPSLLYFKEIENLFGKFGLMLQFTLTEMNYSEVSGLSNIEWDAVDICNKFLTFWLTEKGTMESISGHYKTGDPLPSHILNNLCNVHQHMAGIDLSKEIYFANLDLAFHTEKEGVLSLVYKLWPDHLLFTLHKADSHPFGLKDIFLNPWGASFYSRVWAKMVAADAFYAFVEAGFDDNQTLSSLGKRFRSTFLSSGGGRDPSDVFRDFRGRDPDPKSLLSLLNLPTQSKLPQDERPQLEEGKTANES